MDSIYYDGEWNKIQFNVNTNKAIIYGINFKVSYSISSLFTLYSKNVYTYGWDVSDNIPLGHIPPLYGKAGLNFKIG